MVECVLYLWCVVRMTISESCLNLGQMGLYACLPVQLLEKPYITHLYQTLYNLFPLEPC